MYQLHRKGEIKRVSGPIGDQRVLGFTKAVYEYAYNEAARLLYRFLSGLCMKYNI